MNEPQAAPYGAWRSPITADMIVVLDHGKLVETGTHHELIRRNGTYARLYHEQTRGLSTIEPHSSDGAAAAPQWA